MSADTWPDWEHVLSAAAHLQVVLPGATLVGGSLPFRNDGCYLGGFHTVSGEERMNRELIQMVANKIGVSEDKASTAVETIVGYVKDKLPQPIASQVDNVVSGGGSTGGLGSKVSDMFGGTERK